MIQGQKFRVLGYFHDETNALVDPDNVFFIWQVGNGAKTTYQYNAGAEIVKETTGTYYVDIDTTSFFGIFSYRWYSTGDIQTTHSRQAVDIEKADP